MDSIIKLLLENHKLEETEKTLKSRYNTLNKMKTQDPDIDSESVINAIRIHTKELKELSQEFDNFVNSKHQYDFKNQEIHSYLRDIDQQVQLIRRMLRTEK